MSAPLLLNVQPGAARRLAGNLTAGTWIRNGDSTHGVWLSPTSTVQPGTGIWLGPLASTAWEVQQDLFACVDTGVTSPVGLVLTDAINVLDDPVAVGAAVAARLVTSGIPAVFLNTVIGVWDTFFGNAIAPGASVTVDIYQFATLTMEINSNPPGKVYMTMETHEAPVGGVFDAIIGNEAFSVNDSTVSGRFAVPVVGQSAVFTNRGTQPLQLSLFGNNRLLGTPQPINIGGQNSPRVLNSVVTTVAPPGGTKIPILTADSGPSSTNFNGPVSFRLAVTGTAKPSFLIQMVYYDPAAVRSPCIIDSASFHAVEGTAVEWDYYGSLVHPVGVVGWQAAITATPTAPAVKFFLEMIPS